VRRSQKEKQNLILRFPSTIDDMRIYIHVVPSSNQCLIEELGENQYKVRLCASPTRGRANKELIKLLSKYFKVAKSQIEIIGGKTSREKIVDIIER